MYWTMYELAILNLLVMISMGVTYGMIEYVELRLLIIQAKRTADFTKALKEDPNVIGEIVFNGITNAINRLVECPQHLENLFSISRQAMIDGIMNYMDEIKEDPEVLNRTVEVVQVMSSVGAEAIKGSVRKVAAKATDAVLKEELPFIPKKWRGVVAKYMSPSEGEGTAAAVKTGGKMPPLK